MDQAAEYTKQGVWPTAGNLSPEQYVEGVFSTYLYTGTGSALNIVNNIDLAAKGGLVWTKRRTSSNSHWFLDSVRGGDQIIRSNTNESQFTSAGLEITSFNSDGYTLGTASDINSASQDDASWTFLKKPGFFDIVTYTGTGSNTTVSHNLGSAPGVIIVKSLSAYNSWAVYHRSVGATKYLLLNDTNAPITNSGYWNDTAPTSTEFSVGTNGTVNNSGASYVAYLFAHDDQRFGDNSNESIIKCGTFTGTSSGEVSVDLGWEPQFIIYKLVNNASYLNDDNWRMHDVMRGWDVSNRELLNPNSTAAESTLSNTGGYEIKPTATGFIHEGHATADGDEYIYIAIRRPMKTPEAGTEVFTPIARTGTGATAEVTGVGFSPDMLLQARRTAPDWPTSDRLRGVGKNLGTPYTQAETTPSPAYIDSYDMDGVTLGSGNAVNGSGLTYIEYFFKRAPGFFDVVAYTGNGSPSNTVRRDLNHNLGVTPELAILKRRDSTSEWQVGVNGTSLYLNLSNGSAGTYTHSSYFNATDFDVEGWITEANNNVSGATYVVYLFATLAGVSKVGSFTHTSGSDTNVDCGFTSGARFVLIKRTDATDGWQVYDTARGINSGADPVLQLNDTAAEFSQDLMDPYSAGFTITGTKTSGTYIFLAIA
jgi:hypothetical protein